MVPRFSAENFPKIMDLVKELQTVAKRKSATPAQVTLAWLMAQGDDIFPIPGTRTVKYLDENVGAAKLELTDGEVQEIRTFVDKTDIKGGRYPEMSVEIPPIS